MSKRLGAVKWETIRAEYETGGSQNELAKKHEVSRAAIQKRIKKEGWTQEDISAAVNRKVAEKVAGVVAGSNPLKKAKAIDAEADRVVTVISRHRNEWNRHIGLVTKAVDESDFETAKLAKITAETIMIRQTGERRAWGIDKNGSQEDKLSAFLKLLPPVSRAAV